MTCPAGGERSGQTTRLRRSVLALFLGTALGILTSVGLSSLRGRAENPADVGRFLGDVRRPIPADSALAARAMRAECGHLEEEKKTECYRRELSRRREEAGVRPAMNTLDYLVMLDTEIAQHAHLYAHHIGLEAYRIRRDVAETFGSCTESFSSGCYHGVIQAYFQDRGTPDEEVVRALCEAHRGSGQSRWILFQCLHGMGHGLTMYYDHDLPRGLLTCDLLQDAWERESCYGGAFMENVMAVTTPHHLATMLGVEERTEDAPPARGAGESGHSFRAIDPEDPLYPCSAMDRRYLGQCYLMQTNAMLHLNGSDLADAARSCERAPGSYARTCHMSLGRGITSSTRQPKRAERLCRSASASYRGWCYVGVVKALVDFSSAAEAGMEFCRVVESVEHKSMCYRALGEEVGVLLAGYDERTRVCRMAEPEHVSDCWRGVKRADTIITGEEWVG